MQQQAQQLQMQFQQSQTQALSAQAQESQARAAKLAAEAAVVPQELEIDKINAITRNLREGDAEDKEFERRMKVADTLLKEKQQEPLTQQELQVRLMARVLPLVLVCLLALLLNVINAH